MAGIQNTEEMIVAMGDSAGVIYMAQKAARKPDGSIDFPLLGQNVAAQFMTNPALINDLKAAMDGAGEIPAELKDLTMLEGLQLAATCGKVATATAAKIGM